ncbi:putative ribonuclease H-like domain-containing protein, partial [Tanacetum coccineum]
QEANHNAGTEDIIDAGDSEKEAESAQDYFVLPIWSSYSSTVKRSTAKDAGEAPNKHPDLKTDEKPVDKEDQVFLDELERLKRQEQDANDAAEAVRKKFAQETEELLLQAGAAKASSTNIVNTASTLVSTASPYGGLSFTDLTNPDDSEIPALEDIYNNPTDGIFKNSSYDAEGAVANFINLEPVVNVSPITTSRINSIHPSTQILRDPQSAVQTRSKVTKSSRAHAFILVNLPYGKKAIGTKWVYRNKKNERGVVVRNKARLVAQGHRQDEGIDYDEVFAHVARIGAIRIFLAFASYMGFIVYQMDVKNAFLYGKIDEEVYVSQPTSFIDPKYPKKRSWCDEFDTLMKSRFQMSSIGELTFFLGLQVKQKEDGIFISQDKYVVEILKKFDFVNVKTASIPIETHKSLVKDEEASDVDVNPKTSHLSAVKRIFRYLKGKPKLGLWYPRVSSFDLEAYSDSDYAGANLDRKSTTGGCQFLGRRLISWQCKKQTIMATSTTEAEYVAAANCCGQVLWIQNQMLDYGFNFMNTKIYIDNESTICIVKNLVFHSKTKHIAIRHHFIRDAYEKKLIQVLKIHTDDNVADLLTKAFDVSRESLGRALDGTEALLLPKLFILWLAKVSTDSGKLIPVGQRLVPFSELKENTTKVHSRNLSQLLSFIQTLISHSSTITNSTTMAVLESCPKHNMVAYLEKTNGNAEFHEFIDFLMRSSIHNALTGKASYLVSHILVQPTEDEGEQSERPSEPQPTPSSPHPKDSGGNQGGQSSSDRSLSGNEGDMTLQSVYDLCISLCSQVTDQAKEIKHLKAQIKKPKKKAKPGRKSAKAEPSVHKDPLFDGALMIEIDQLWRLRMIKNVEGRNQEDSTKGKVSIVRPDVVLREIKRRSATPTTPTTFRDDETITQPLPKIDPKDKGKKKIEEEDESDTESEGEEEVKKLAEEEATNAALIQDFDDIKARMEADRLLALRLQEEEREQFTMEERAKFLHDTISAQRRFLAEQRAAAIRNRPPTRTQLRNQMMTYLKHDGNKKHSDLKNKTFKEIQALYEKVKRFDESFTAKVAKETPKKEDTAKVPAKEDVIEQGTKKRKGGHMKMIARKRKRPQPDVDSDDEHRKCLKIVTFEGTIDSEVMEKKSFISKLDKVSSPEGDYLVIYRANGNFRAFNYLLEKKMIKVISGVINKEVVTWRLYEACGVYILELKDGTVIHMLVERRYPLSKDLLQRMLDLRLEVNEKCTVP